MSKPKPTLTHFIGDHSMLNSSTTLHRRFVAVVLLLSIFISAGCEMPSPSSSKKTSPFDAISGYDLIGDYDDTLSAFVRFSGTVFMDKGNVSKKLAVANAVFLDSTLVVAVDPSSVSCNGYSLSRGTNLTVHTQGNQGLYVGKSAANWVVTGYEGQNYSFGDNLPADLVITSHAAGDTVSKSSGFTITYSGNAGGDLAILAAFDPAFTKAYVDTTAAFYGGTGEYHGVTSDDGSVTFTSGNLASFSTGRFIKVVLMHWGYDVHQAATDRKFGALRTIAVEIPLYLAP